MEKCIRRTFMYIMLYDTRQCKTKRKKKTKNKNIIYTHTQNIVITDFFVTVVCNLFYAARALLNVFNNTNNNNSNNNGNNK